MTEEIIVDGVNVAGCAHLVTVTGGEPPFCRLDNFTCEGETCYFKQFKRLEQDIKQLTQWLDEARNNADFWCNKCTNLEQENKANLKQIELDVEHICRLNEQIEKLEQENKELKEWKERVVKLFESACRCKYLNEETDICSYTNGKCININKCVYKYQELSGAYRSALEEIRNDIMSNKSVCTECIKIAKQINEVLK